MGRLPLRRDNETSSSDGSRRSTSGGRWKSWGPRGDLSHRFPKYTSLPLEVLRHVSYGITSPFILIRQHKLNFGGLSIYPFVVLDVPCPLLLPTPTFGPLRTSVVLYPPPSLLGKGLGDLPHTGTDVELNLKTGDFDTLLLTDDTFHWIQTPLSNVVGVFYLVDDSL